MTARLEAIRANPLEQYAALRCYYLPHADDSIENIARALWLDEYFATTHANKTAAGIGIAFNGK
ncbi:DUF6890 family protein [Erwinia pyrifoliae]|uniref:DUF6890 family protein n=1 Tax=Erwinia pyrifoliae TaxID=79967 RepID=UPI0035CD30F2